MNTEWMRGRLERFIATLQEYDRQGRALPGGAFWDELTMGPTKESIEEQLPGVERIIEALDPNLLGDEFGQDEVYGGMNHSESVTRKALAVLNERDEWAANLGSEGPRLSAAQLHPWVWGAAAQFWDAGQHSVAVEYGAKSITAHVQAKSGLTVADRELAAEVFSAKPSTKTVRLWLPGDRASDTWKSRQDGLHQLSMGAFAGIRNVVAHTLTTDWTEQDALEYLAVLSTVARWAEETQVFSVDDQAP